MSQSLAWLTFLGYSIINATRCVFTYATDTCNSVAMNNEVRSREIPINSIPK